MRSYESISIFFLTSFVNKSFVLFFRVFGNKSMLSTTWHSIWSTLLWRWALRTWRALSYQTTQEAVIIKARCHFLFTNSFSALQCILEGMADLVIRYVRLSVTRELCTKFVTQGYLRIFPFFKNKKDIKRSAQFFLVIRGFGIGRIFLGQNPANNESSLYS